MFRAFDRSLSACAAAAVALILTTLTGGCSISRMACRGAVDNMVRGMSAYDRETDLQLAETAAAGQLMLLEGLLETEPDNRELLLLTSQSFARYTYGFVEPHIEQARLINDGDTRHRLSVRAVSLYRRASDFARRALKSSNPKLDDAIGSDPERLAEALKRADSEDLPALFWLAFSWGNHLRLQPGGAEYFSDLTKVTSIMQRILELDESYYFGSAHLYFGIYYCSLPPGFGRDLDRAGEHFERAIEITDGRYLMARYLMVRHYFAATMNQAAVTGELEDVLSAPDDCYPQQNLANQIAKQQARQLLAATNGTP